MFQGTGKRLCKDASRLSLQLLGMPFVVATTAEWVRDETCTTIRGFDPLATWMHRCLLVRQCEHSLTHFPSQPSELEV